MTVFEGLIDIPDDVTDFHLYLDQSTSTFVPEPTLAGLLGCGGLLLLGRRYRA